MKPICIGIWLDVIGLLAGTLDWNRATFSSYEYDKVSRRLSNTPGVEYNDGFEELVRRRRSVCGGLCKQRELPPCYCDSLCHAYQDCCPENTSERPSKPSEIHNELSCEMFSHFDTAFNKPYGFVVVKTCMKKYVSSSLADRCSDTTNQDFPLQVIPATTKSGLTFANVFCALCNDVENVSPWDLAAYLPRKDFLSTVDLSVMLHNISKYSILIPVPGPNLKPRVCVRTADVENLTDSEREECNKYQDPVLYATKIFRSRHCIPKDVIQGCHPDKDPNECKSVCIDKYSVSISDYLFMRKPQANSILIKFGRHLQLQYESSKCDPGESPSTSKVKCVQLSCVDHGNELCRPFDVYYTKLKLQFRWHLRTRSSISAVSVRTCANMILNLLLFSRITSVLAYYVLESYEEDCGVHTMTAALNYVDLLPLANAESLQTWLSTVHFTYTEIRESTKSVLERVYPGTVHLSDTFHQSVCNVLRSTTYVEITEDRESMVTALARFPLPLPMHKCSHINITLSVTEVVDRYGKGNRKYVIDEVDCKSKVPVLFSGLRNTVMIACIGRMVELFKIRWLYCS